MVTENNPIIARRYRGQDLESLHRGAWAIVDTDGAVIAGAGDPDQMIFARSSSKSIQALGTLATGVIERFGLDPAHLAVMVASHNGDGLLDVSDAVSQLLFLFAGGSPSPLGTDCAEVVDCPTICLP